MDDKKWRDRAACKDEPDAELWFPVGESGPELLKAEEAKKVCRRCPVRDACLDFALDSDSDHGVWGGLAERERRPLHREVRRARREAKARAKAA